MSEIDIYDRLGASKPLRLRGLKSELLQHLSIAGRSKPLRLRGLKFKGGKSVIYYYVEAFAASWIEIFKWLFACAI